MLFLKKKKEPIEAKEKWIKSLLLSIQDPKGILVINDVVTGISLN